MLTRGIWALILDIVFSFSFWSLVSLLTECTAHFFRQQIQSVVFARQGVECGDEG